MSPHSWTFAHLPALSRRVTIVNITSMLKEGLDEVVSWSVSELAAAMGVAGNVVGH